ncbi:MAG: dihydrofolate reductase [Prevotella sp.]|nr:dihydrofolate reductase [Candidatus Equicola stercoris]
MKSIIVAIAKNFAIGKNNDLLYHLPDDLKHFKEITSGHTVIMGKNTFESFPKRPLPNRRNIVVAFPEEIPDDRQGAEWVTSLDEAFRVSSNDGEVFVIGGAYVYRQTFPMVDKLYLTIIDDEPTDVDVYFPEIDFSQWQEISRVHHDADERHAHSFDFCEFTRR